jgi:hypothetical protein
MIPTAKYHCIILILICFSLSASAQIFNRSRGIFDKSNKKMVLQMIDKKTTVYVTGKSAYAQRMKKAFTDHWKVNPVQFAENNAKISIESNSGVFKPVIISAINGRGNETSQNYPFFVYGQADSDGGIIMETLVAAFPITFLYEFDVLSDTNLYHRSLLRLPYMVSALNDMLTFVKTNGDDKGYVEAVEARASKIGGKTLIIPSDLIKEWDVNPNTTALMKNDLSKGRKPMKQIMYNILEESAISYAGKYKIMSNEEIIKLETSTEADKYTIFLPAIDDKKYLEVYDLKTKELLYFEDITMSMKIKSKDFGKLNKAAGL